MLHSARVHSFDSASQFLEFLLRKDAPTTTLIVCSTRDSFLEQLASSSRNHALQRSEEPPDHGPASGTPLFVSNSIGLIARSQRVKLAFCPSLEVLRAYLPTVEAQVSTKRSQSQSTRRPLLAILNLVSIHTDTLELSAQGLSRTFSLVAEVASRENMNLSICECKNITASEHGTETASGPWDCRVPLLSASVGMGEGERQSARHTVTVKRVAQKWFDFDNADTTET